MNQSFQNCKPFQNRLNRYWEIATRTLPEMNTLRDLQPTGSSRWRHFRRGSRTFGSCCAHQWLLMGPPRAHWVGPWPHKLRSERQNITKTKVFWSYGTAKFFQKSKFQNIKRKITTTKSETWLWQIKQLFRLVLVQQPINNLIVFTTDLSVNAINSKAVQ